MCGIGGIVGRFTGVERGERLAPAMADRLAHRGPDGSGTVRPGDTSLLIHRRLAVIDLPGGAQPMVSAARTLWIAANGEIYNHRQLRTELERQGAVFATQSDTEVILHLYEREGAESFRKLIGMFAFALWDEPAQKLLLVRDAFGMKPLCYAVLPGRLAFASEAKALLAHPDVPRDVDAQAVHDSLNLRFVPSPLTLWRAIRRLEPGQMLEYRVDDEPRLTPWLVPPAATPGVALDTALAAAVERHLVSDVPVGVLLSGGLDSNALLATAARQGRALPAFTLGFGDKTDEVEAARESATHFGAPFASVMIDPAAAARDYEAALWHMEEPRVNILQGYALARFVAPRVKVALSGMGGDELTGGYHTHRWFSLLYAGGARPVVPGAGTLRAGLRAVNAALGPRTDLAGRGLDLLLSAGDPARAWATLRNAWDHQPSRRAEIYGSREPTGLLPVSRHFAPLFRDQPPLAAVFAVEQRFKLADDFLAAEDRMSMAHGLEVRAPFLDPALVGWARALPESRHVALGRGKVAYRAELLRSGLLPGFIARRAKWGFSIDPVRQYERTLKPLVESVLTRDALERIAPVSPDYARQLLALPAGRTLRWHRFFLWMLAGFVLWHRLFIEGDGERPGAVTA